MDWEALGMTPEERDEVHLRLLTELYLQNPAVVLTVYQRAAQQHPALMAKWKERLRRSEWQE